MVSKFLRVSLMGLSTTLLLRAGEETQQKVGVTVVEVPVRVTDRHGKPVNDLRAADFAITDDRKPQDIVSVSLVGASSASKGMVSGGGSEILSSPPRSFILLFDQILTGQFSIVKAQQAASEFVRDNLRPQDSVAVIALTSSGYRVVIAPTRDRELAVQAISGRAPQPGTLLVARSESLVRPTDDSSFWSSSASGRTARESEFWTRDSTALAAFWVRDSVTNYLNALQALAIRLKSLQGPKTILFFSEGTSVDTFVPPFQLPASAGRSVGAWDADWLGSGWGSHDPAADGSSQWAATSVPVAPPVSPDLITRVSRTLSSAECRVYAIDSAGVVFGLKSRFRDNFILEDIASETGGKLFESRNDFDNCLRSAADEATAYYLLLYTPPPGNSGRYHKIHVNVNRPGLEVTHRKGYFEPSPFRKSSDLEKTMQVEAAFNGGYFPELTSVRLTVQPLPKNRRDDSGAGSLASIIVSPEVLDGLMGDASKSLELYLVPIATRSRQGLGLFHFEVPVPKEARGSKWVHSESVKLPDNADQLRAVLVDSETGASIVAATSLQKDISVK